MSTRETIGVSFLASCKFDTAKHVKQQSLMYVRLQCINYQVDLKYIVTSVLHHCYGEAISDVHQC